MSFQHWLRRRETGLAPCRGDGNLIMARIYKSMERRPDLFDEYMYAPGHKAENGAVYNLEFSPEGNVLVSACEKSAIDIYDVVTRRISHTIPDAHSLSVNCIRFLDNHVFATSSDDTTVALWDLRNMKAKMRSLQGHSSWVKNIEYSRKNKLLLTSGFDGSIFTWDINSHTEQGLIYQKVFHTSGLMRSRLTPDASKLVICTTGGFLMVIHDLDLTTLHKDLCGFRPNIYRLMQMGDQFIPQAAKFDYVFSKQQRKNRVELVTDFPTEDDAEVIMSLEIHPQGHSFLSRNISYGESSEWTCLHDITEEPTDITETVKENTSGRKRKITSSDEEDPNAAVTHELINIVRRHRRPRLPVPAHNSAPPPPPPTAPPPTNLPNVRTDAFVPDIWAAEVTMQERAIRQNRGRTGNSVTGYNFVYAISSGVVPLATSGHQTTTSSSNGTRRNASTTTNTNEELPHRSNRSVAGIFEDLVLANVGGGSSSSSSSSSSNSNSSSSHSSTESSPLRPHQRLRMRPLLEMAFRPITRDKQIFQNAKKLMYYIKEPNKGQGLIKESCFSADGRMICSPYESGIRLLGFSEDCSEYPRHCNDLIKTEPRKLTVIKNIQTHADIVLCAKFSPCEPVLVTGCRSGRVVWHHPNI